MLVAPLLLSLLSAACEESACTADWEWNRRQLPNPCRATPAELATTYALPEAVVPAAKKALGLCGRPALEAWKPILAAAPQSPLPLAAVVFSTSYDARPAALDALLRATDGAEATALRHRTLGVFPLDEVRQWLVKHGSPSALVALAREGQLTFDDLGRVASPEVGTLPDAERAELEALVVAKRALTSGAEVKAAWSSWSPGLRAAVGARLAKPPSLGAPNQPRTYCHWAGQTCFEVRLLFTLARAHVGLPVDSWTLLLALESANPTDQLAVAAQLTGPHQRRLALVAKRRAVRLDGVLSRVEAEYRASYTAERDGLLVVATRLAGDAGVVGSLGGVRPLVLAALSRAEQTPWVVAPAFKPAPKARLAAPPELPRGYWLVDQLVADGQWFALATSQRMDPTGEVSRGAYWLLRLTGATWEPIATGLRDLRPWRVSDKRPAFSVQKGVVQLRLERRALDEGSITFPPVSLATSKGKPVVLEAPLAALLADTDSDGLTDVAERRLLLDPGSADTDADGLSDLDDPVPLAAQHEPGRDEELLTAAMRAIDGSDQPALLTQPDAKGLSLPQPLPREPVGTRRFRFVSADPASLTHVASSDTHVVLSDDEFDAARKVFGAFYGSSFEVEVDDAGTHALVTWSESWRGGSLFAERIEGRWVFWVLDLWIT